MHKKTGVSQGALPISFGLAPLSQKKTSKQLWNTYEVLHFGFALKSYPAIKDGQIPA